MLKEKIKEAKEKYNSLVHERSALLENANKATEAKDLHEIRSQISDKNKALEEVKAEIEDLENLQTEEKRSFAGNFNIQNNKADDPQSISTRDAINHYIHTRDDSQAASIGLKSADASVTIPELIKYVPEKEIKTIPDLSQYINKVDVTAPSGKYPVLKRATSVLHTVAELEQNPELKKPEFTSVDWSVDTYRGAIPVSEESIQDSSADLMGIVAQGAYEMKVNTSNQKIAEKFKTFTAQTLNTANYIDDMKYIINVGLDKAYNKQIICSASFYNILDTMKDKNGRYIWENSWTNDTSNVLKSTQVISVPDEIFGAKGTAVAFVGDGKRAIMMPNRVDGQIRWIDDDIYGQKLMTFARMGWTITDADAGFYVTASAAGK